jgi:hypothetical protein
MRRDEVLTLLAANRERLRAMGVDRLSVFGSVVRDEARAGSDIDILVEFTPDARIGMFEFLELKEVLSGLLGAEVDLATPASLHPRLRDSILAEAVRAAWRPSGGLVRVPESASSLSRPSQCGRCVALLLTSRRRSALPRRSAGSSEWTFSCPQR